VVVSEVTMSNEKSGRTISAANMEKLRSLHACLADIDAAVRIGRQHTSTLLASNAPTVSPDDEEALDVDMDSPDPPRNPLPGQRPKPGGPWAPDDTTNPVGPQGSAKDDDTGIDEADLRAALQMLPALISAEVRATVRDLARRDDPLPLDRVQRHSFGEMVREETARALRQMRGRLD